MVEVEDEDEAWTGTYEEFERAVIGGRFRRSALVRFPPVTGDGWQALGDLELARPVLDGPAARFAARFSLGRLPRATLATATLLLCVFLWQQGSGPLDVPRLVEQGAKSLAHQRELGQWWRLATGSLLHASWLHLLPNMLYLLYVGWSVEAVLGASSTALLLVASGLAGMAASSLAGPAAAVGASGMAFGLFGAVIALGWRYDHLLPTAAKVRYGWPVVPFVPYFLVVGLLWDSVDNLCHVGGLLAGGALGLFLPAAVDEPADWTRPVGRGLLAVSLLGLVVVGLPLAWRAGLLPRVRLDAPVVEGEAGFTIRPPSEWLESSQPTGPSWQSPTGQARLSTRADTDELGDPTPESVRRHWVEEMERRAVVLPYREPDPAELGLGPQWFTLESDLMTADRVALRSTRVGRIRGRYITTVEFLTTDTEHSAYRELRRRVIGSVSLRTPRAIGRALEVLLERDVPAERLDAELEAALPQAPARSPAGALRLAAELARFGDRQRARLLIDALLEADPNAGDLLFWDLWVDHHLGGGSGHVDRARRLAELQPDSLQANGLAFDVLVAARDPFARAVLARMELRWPNLSATKRRRARLPPD